MGGFGEGFGRGLEALGAFWVVLEALFSFLYLEWFSKVLLEASGLDFGSILMGFGRILGRFGQDFGKFFSFSTNLGQILDIFEKMCLCWGRFSK